MVWDLCRRGRACKTTGTPNEARLPDRACVPSGCHNSSRRRAFGSLTRDRPKDGQCRCNAVRAPCASRQARLSRTRSSAAAGGSQGCDLPAETRRTAAPDPAAAAPSSLRPPLPMIDQPPESRFAASLNPFFDSIGQNATLESCSILVRSTDIADLRAVPLAHPLVTTSVAGGQQVGAWHPGGSGWNSSWELNLRSRRAPTPPSNLPMPTTAPARHRCIWPAA